MRRHIFLKALVFSYFIFVIAGCGVGYIPTAYQRQIIENAPEDSTIYVGPGRVIVIDMYGNSTYYATGGPTSSSSSGDMLYLATELEAAELRKEARLERKEMFKSANDPWKKTKATIIDSQLKLLNKHQEIINR